MKRLLILSTILALNLNLGFAIQKEHVKNDSIKSQTEAVHSTNMTSVNENQGEVTESSHEGHGLNLAPFLFIVLSLFIGTATRHLFSKVPLPYTIILLIIGLTLGILTRFDIMQTIGLDMVGQAVQWAGNIDPHLILYLFLPTLIFEAAYALHIHTFKKSLANALILAVPGILVAIAITAFALLLIKSLGIGLNEWTFLLAFLFGTIISATDPVAVVAILKEVGASKRLSTITESESMLNDGTAIVIFMTIFGLITGEAAGGNAFVNFLRVSLGGVLVGAVIGWGILSWLKKVFNDALIEITVVIGAAYLSFYLAESVLHVSGVIAVVTLGISMAGPGKTKVSPEVTHFLHEFWELAAFIANTLIFIIVGVVIAQQVNYTISDLKVLLLVYITIHIARLGTIYVFYPLMRRIGYGIAFKDSIVLWWGGLRGAVALALTLIVAIDSRIPLEPRNQLLSLTAGIVILTSLINATTVRWLIDKFGLSKIGDIKAGLMMQSLQQIRLSGEKEIEKLKENRYMSGADWDKVSSFLIDVDSVEEKPQHFNLEDTIAETRKRLLQKEKESYWRQFSMGMLSSEGVNLLSDQIDALLDYGGKIPLSTRQNIENIWTTPKTIAKLQNLPLVGRIWKRKFLNRLALSYDCARTFVAAQEENQKSLSSLIIGFSIGGAESSKETELLSALEDELNENRITGQTFLRNLREKYPDICRSIETLLASRSLLNQQEEMLERLKKQGRLEPDEVERIQAYIHASMKQLIDTSLKENTELKVAAALRNTPGLKNLSKDAQQFLISKGLLKIYPEGSVIAKQGSEPDGIFIIINGTANYYESDTLTGVKEISDVFGAYEWLLSSRLRYTFTAETPVTLIKINTSTIKLLTSKFPETKRLLTLCASADIALELLKQNEKFSELSIRKLRTLIRNAELFELSRGEKHLFSGSACILVKGQAITDEQDTLFTAPAILDECNLRSKGDALALILP
ncbi:MAG TPA: cyclic nucleotide-binding domain-containing protein [Bacteroidales bacterium]|nr:cyclic nucleotide-binding domain-containing protein [Bacteroidales bacterium]